MSSTVQPCSTTHHAGCACHEARRDARIAELEAAQARHLQLIADLSRAEPLPGEAEEHRRRNGVLMAEVGTLKGEVRELRRFIDDVNATAREALRMERFYADGYRLSAWLLAWEAIGWAHRWRRAPQVKFEPEYWRDEDERARVNMAVITEAIRVGRQP